MKTLIAALCLVSTVTWAQDPPPPARSPRSVSRFGLQPTQAPNENQSEVLPENYLVTLVISDKDKVVTEISLVAATTNFSITTGDPRISFGGTMTPDDQGGVLLRYGLGINVAVYEGNTVSYRDSSAQASAKVRLGEPIQILKSGTQSYKLTISRLSEETKKKK